MDTQLDIFGNEIPVEQALGQKSKETIKSRWRKMYGFDNGHKCGGCRFCFRITQNDDEHYKCNMMGVSDTAETDINTSDPSCSRWEKRS